MMGCVREAFYVYSDQSIGIAIPDNVANEIRAEIYRILKNNVDQCVACDWTINASYRDDGEQIGIHYPDNREYTRSIDERIAGILNFKRNLGIQIINYTNTEPDDEYPRDIVSQMCGQVARGELEIEPHSDKPLVGDTND